MSDDENRSLSPDPTPPPTIALLTRWRAGDAEAFRVLEDRFRRMLRARIRHHPSWITLAPHCDVDDAQQEFWSEALAAIREKFVDAGPGSLLGYLLTIADRTVMDMARRHGARKRGRDREHAMTPGFDTATPMPGVARPATPTSEARVSEILQLARRILNARELDV